jgi:hypothetical protein
MTAVEARGESPGCPGGRRDRVCGIRGVDDVGGTVTQVEKRSEYLGPNRSLERQTHRASHHLAHRLVCARAPLAREAAGDEVGVGRAVYPH